ncbi:MAG TPA: nitrilase-related carbon-nitrogen hydrolase [Terriglobales bacterium]|nr:nitrilase-related carbon-nitrogen hydrolase [Terriglobales bacterium]
MSRYCVAIAQINPRLGDVEANLAIYEQQLERAKSSGADLVVFPELSLTGYFLKDMVPGIALRLDAPIVSRLRELSRGCALVAGFVEEASDFRFYNSAAYFEDGELRHVHRKVYLPTYGLFDEGRYFARGARIRAFDSKFGRCAILICEDMWHVSTAYIATLDGALSILCPSTSPLRGIPATGMQDENARYWEMINTTYAQTFALSIVYANRVGFEDGVGFWGGSEIVAADGERRCKAEYYEEDLVMAEIDTADVRRQRVASPLLRDEEVELTINELIRIGGRPCRDEPAETPLRPAPAVIGASKRRKS